MTPEKKAAEVKKLNKRLTDINKKLAALKDGGVITLGNTITMSPEYDALKLKKDQVEAELKRLGEEPTETKEDKSDLDDEINALRKGVTDVFPSSDTLSSEEFKGYINDIRNAKTLPELKEAYDHAIFMIMSESDIVFSDMLENAYNLKALALQVNTSQENLAKGEYLISKNPIFTDSTDEIVVIAKIGDGKVVVKEIGVKKPRQRTFTDAQIQASFTKTTAEALKQDEEDMSVTIEEKQNAAISKSSIEAFAQNPELINQANKNAEKSRSERLAALKNASENDNINKCKPE